MYFAIGLDLIDTIVRPEPAALFDFASSHSDYVPFLKWNGLAYYVGPFVSLVIRGGLPLQGVWQIVLLLLSLLLLLKHRNDLHKALELPAIDIAAAYFQLFKEVFELLGRIVFANDVIVEICLLVFSSHY